MGTKVNNFQNNAKNSNIILTQKSSETETNGSVTIFKNSEFGDIRTIVDPNGDVWFVAIDVARSLGYATPKNPIKRHVDEEDTILLQLSDFQRGSFWAPLEINELDSIRVINESGLYSLVLSSKLESATMGNIRGSPLYKKNGFLFYNTERLSICIKSIS